MDKEEEMGKGKGSKGKRKGKREGKDEIRNGGPGEKGKR